MDSLKVSLNFKFVVIKALFVCQVIGKLDPNTGKEKVVEVIKVVRGEIKPLSTDVIVLLVIGIIVVPILIYVIGKYIEISNEAPDTEAT